MGKQVGTKTRQPGSLRRVVKKARGKEYPSWQWRTHRRTDVGWKTVDLELGRHINTLRARVYVGLGDLSAPLLIERFARYSFNHYPELPAWTSTVPGSKQRAAWWVALPRKEGEGVSLAFRKLKPCTMDFRWKFFRDRVAEIEKTLTQLWEDLRNDPVMKLARLQWLAAEAEAVGVRTEGYLIDARRAYRAGDYTKAEFDERQSELLVSQDAWQGIRSRFDGAYDDLLAEITDCLPRPTRDELLRRIHQRVEQLLSSGQQRAAWHNEHWIDGTLHWSL